MSEKKTRAKSPKLRDSFRVIIVEREKFDTAEKAASELGLTKSSFKQLVGRLRKRYPDQFDNVPHYGSSGGPKVESSEEAASILADLLGE